MDTHIAEEHRKKAEELTTQCVTKMQNDPVHSANHIYNAIATALQEAADTARGDKLVVVFNTLCKIKDLGNDEHMSVARSLAQSGLSVFEFDKNENPVLSHTQRTAQQTEAFIAKALRKNLTVVGGK